MTKICNKCKKESDNPSQDFHSDRSKKDGLCTICKACKTKNATTWQDANKEHKAEYDKARRSRDDIAASERARRLRRAEEGYLSPKMSFILNYLLGHPCVDCKEDDIRVLEFDHLPEYQKLFSISRSHREEVFDIEMIKKEIDKCEVRCKNCHKKKTLERAKNSKVWKFWEKHQAENPTLGVGLPVRETSLEVS